MEKKATLDNYIILKTLGAGATGSVKLGLEPGTGELRALKILDPYKIDIKKIDVFKKSLENELDIMRTLDHPNIIRFYDLCTQGVYHTKKGQERSVAYTVTEWAPNGEMFEVLFKVGPFNDNMARYYMKQLVSALGYLHSRKLAHRDLKPENLLIDANKQLKLIDFGFATLCKQNVKNVTRLGTEGYMCPELVYDMPYTATKADIFAAGVLLFIFYSGHPPFAEAKLDDYHYKLFVTDKENFWQCHSERLNNRLYPESFKELVTKMLELVPTKRISIEDVKNSTWMNQSVDEKKALDDMGVYLKAMKKILKLKDNSAIHDQPEQIEKENAIQPQISIRQPSLPPADYNKVKIKHTQFESYPSVIEIECSSKKLLVDGIIKAIQEIPDAKIVWNEAQDGFKILSTKNQTEAGLFKVLILQDDTGLYGVHLIRLGGTRSDFYVFRDIFEKRMCYVFGIV